ncbi:YfcC family protein [Thermosediminibacter litoriperuensis]|uniref:Putative ion transporter superfamily protein YfcC n=1 Tax=Thermosediminibacter litoriperuensis TaxID=291989 RepID=A0A5S5AKI6_9FIRM|nr:TIGR00366 family protein [Thermosediminibacter litoriperuensis]TYP51597.1 putative ion transporter superfamily protein YfcC [Thermosediminibacter litoriperuensis]
MEKKTKYTLDDLLHPFIILFTILVIVALMTHLIPAGVYDKVEVGGKLITKAGSYHQIQPNPINLMEFFMAIPQGLQNAAALIFMIFLIGGAIRVFDSTGVFNAALSEILKRTGKDNGVLVIAFLTIFFACIGAFPSMFEATIPFAPILISIALALGYDEVVGVSMGLLGVVIGWTSGPTNPWTVGIGQTIAQLPMFSGIGYRLVILVILTAITIIYISIYGKRIKQDPSRSVVYGINTGRGQYNSDNIFKTNFTTKHGFILLDLALTIGLILYGTFNWKWGITEMSAVYIMGGIIAGALAGFNPSKTADEFIMGGKNIFPAAMAVGLARSIQVLMDNAQISDTIVHYLSIPLAHLPTIFTAIGMFIVQSILNFFIPSGSGLAMVTMPIMVSLSDVLHLNRQIAILAFQYGDGLSNLCFPTTAVTMAFLSIAKIPFNKWLRYIMPYLLITWGFAAVSLIVAVLINYGPF